MRVPRSSRPSASIAWGRNASPAGLSFMPRPSRSVSGTPTSSLSAAMDPDTDGCETCRRSAAARTEPSSATAMNVRSWESVIAIDL